MKEILRVSLSLDKLNISDNIKTKIRDEFDEVLKLLNFDEKGHDIFKRFYIDGRIYFHKVIDPKSLEKDLQNYDTLIHEKLKRFVRLKKKRDTKGAKGIEIVEQTAEWFVYNEKRYISSKFKCWFKNII